MGIRLAVSIALGVLTAFGLFWVMQALILIVAVAKAATLVIFLVMYLAIFSAAVVEVDNASLGSVPEQIFATTLS